MRILIPCLLMLTFLGCTEDDMDETPSIETFRLFNASNSPLQAATDNLTSLKIDAFNNVWISYREHSSKVLKYNQSADSWQVFGNESFGDSIWAVYDIDFDQSNNVWVGTNDGVFTYDGVAWSSSLRSLFMSNPIPAHNIHVDQSNNVWCSLGSQLYKLENSEWTHMSAADPLFPTQIQKIRSDENGTIWIGSFTGLIKYDGISFVKIEHQPDILSMNIYDIEPITPDNIWIGTKRGLHQWFGSYWQSIDTVAFENPLHEEHNWLVPAIAVHEQTILLGTWNMGLAVLSGGDFQFMRGGEFGIDTNRFQINEVEYDLRQNIWIATRPGDVIVYNENGLK